MKTTWRLLLPFCIVPLTACEAPPPAPPYNTTLEFKQVMEWVLDPAADVIWDSVKTIITEKGTKEIAPSKDAEWDAVRNAAATLIEAGNLLMIQGRARDQKEWIAAAHRLSEAANGAMKAAQAKNTEAVFAEGGKLYEACRGCHLKYAPHLQGDAPAPAKK
jgi:hypothetical protein